MFNVIKLTIHDVWKQKSVNEIIYYSISREIFMILFLYYLLLLFSLLIFIPKEIGSFVHDFFLLAWLPLFVVLCRLTLHVILVSRLLSQRPPMAKGYKFSEEQFSRTWEKSSHAVAGLCTTNLAQLWVRDCP